MTIRVTGKYLSGLHRLISQDADYAEKVERTISWLKKNQKDTRLRFHPLKGRLKDRWAFSIDEDVRIVLKRIGVHTVRFLAIGGHKEVYGK